jgi:hypothetical protein
MMILTGADVETGGWFSATACGTSTASTFITIVWFQIALISVEKIKLTLL